ncbi:MAG: hypothetical protein JST81_09820, partial [Bacteroidetes bacterium]|nr:hypothetical protein [Bacteroidota bacterium]
VNVNTFPNPTVIASGTGPICTNSSVDINATATVSGSGAAIVPNGYQWYVGGSPLGGANLSILSASSAGNYQVTASDANGCISALSTPVVSLAMDNSPLNGFYTIGVGPASCTNYISFAAAIRDLNTRGISGNCIFSTPAGYTETVPSKGLKLGSALLNSNTSTGKTITFSKSGVGANPKLTAFTGGTGASNTTYPDGVWALRGVDNVTIFQIDIAENASNTTSGPQMEYGIGLFKFSSSDGAQNNTIQECNITLNKANATNASPANTNFFPDGATGIVIVNAVDTTVSTQFIPTSANATNSNNKFYGNTISNVHGGIALMGYTAPSPYTLADTNNDIGGTTGTSGNTIVNYGNSGDGVAAIGIRLYNQWGSNASYNTIRNNIYDGNGSNTVNDLRGIRGEASAGASVTYSNNAITLSSGGTGGQNVSGIDNAIGAGGTTNSVIITSNTIIDSSFVTATAAVLTGIINSASVGTLNISNNTLKDCFVNGTGNLTGISNTGTIANSHTMNGNLITNIKKNGSGTLTYLAFGATSGTIPVDASISNNTISNNVVTGGGTNVTMNLVTGGTALYNFDGNTIYNNSITGLTGTAVGTINGFGNAASPTKETINNNIFRKLFITGTSTGVHLIQVIRNVTVAGAVRVVSRNQIDSIYSNAGSTVQITGIINGVGGNVSIFKNKIHSLWPGQNGAGASFAKGITHNTVSGTPTVKIYNNIISLDLSQAAAPAGNGVLTGATAVSGFEVLTTSNSAATINFYYNTIRLAGSGTGTFGSSGIFLANTGPSVDMRNNIVSNYMTPGSGYVVALRRITTSMNGYAATSNNNLWYTTQTASTPISWDGAVAYNTLALFKAALTSPRENLSIGDNPAFVNTAQNDLHLDPSNNCNIDGAGTPIASYTDDYDGDTRDALLPDIGMDEFTGSGTGWTWKGLNTDWMNPSNWCGGVPTATSDVIIPAGKNNYPNITTVAGQAVARNITINLGGSITIANTGTLSNTGTWTNNGTLTNNGTIVLNGTVNQSFPGAGSGTLPAMTNLTVDNTGGATINKPLTILGVLKPKTGNIAVNDVVTLHSDASGTAMVDTLTGSFSYAGPGTFVVERFVSTSSKVGWRFLSIPTNTTQTINQAWMEGQTPGSYTGTGYGTIVVGTGGTANGFDQATTTPSMKTFVPATNSWISVPNTTSSIATTQGYMIFLRGDRAANTFGSQNATTLRTQGPIRSGNVTVSTANGNINQFISVGNPYPAPISFTSASTTKTGLQNTYYVWDPKLSTYGAYQTFTSPGFVANPGGGSYTGGHNAIESGQAFFVVASGSVTPHSITITENSKVSSNFQVARTAGNEAMFSTRLYAGIDTNRVLHDGVRVDFDNAYTNAIDDMDARKMSNVGENVGIIRDGIMLSIERRPEVVSTDTIFYQLGALKQQQYQFEFTPENLVPTLTGYLEDAYLNTSTPVAMDAVNTINFTVNADPASKAANRFRLVFRQLGPVPLSFTSITANKQDRNVLVSWRVDNELDIAQYEVERAADARSFAKIGTQLGRNTGASTQQYNLLDAQPLTGDNFYRVRSVGSNGAVKYSEIVKVNMAGDPSSITAYPNPVKEDGVVKLTLSNKPEGQYIVHIYNAKGQELYNKLINHDGGNSVYTLELNKILVAHGNYMLQVIETNKAKTTFKIVY